MNIKAYLEQIESFENRKILVTGATAGIGLELTKQLLEKGAFVVMLIRNLDKGNKVKEELLKTNPAYKIDMLEYDQSDYDSIDRAIKEIKEKHSDFYAFVANAGILYPAKDELSKQGNPLTIETNYLGLKRALSTIVPLFKNKRYVLEGSLTAKFHVSKKVDIYNNKYTLFKQYNTSKSCVEALFYHFYSTNKDNEFLLVEPGVTSSDIIRGFHEPIRTLGKWFVRFVSHPVNKASLSALKALCSDSKSGDFIIPRGPMSYTGFPKKRCFPKHRRREFLINL